nr:probable LRR receptor-like serine/threonine-protein kinase At1g63430 [Ipomoea batatas]
MRARTFLQLLLATSGLFLLASHAFPSDEVIALSKFKEAIYDDPLLVLTNWDALDSNPCHWNGILCSAAGDHVTNINISRASLKGFLAPELHLIPNLQYLMLDGNQLQGTIPREIGLLKSLIVLDLSNNKFSGPIPREIGNLQDIEKINLRSNGLTGRLPPELSNLKNLEELRLDRNKLKGTVSGSNGPSFASSVHGINRGLCHAKLKFADFSYNFFVGKIPNCLNYLPRSSFQGNCLQVQEISQRPAAQCGRASTPKIHPELNNRHHRPAEHMPKHKSAAKPAWLFALEVVTGVMVATLFVVALLTTIKKCKSKSSIIIPWKKSGSEKDHLAIYVDTEMLKDVTRYSREELEVACEDFSNIIGTSPDSVVYKGTMKGGPEIAVIALCIKEENWTAYLELYYQKEVAELARINHEHTGKLLGYCRESSPFTRMLVFEYASNGTLYEHLHYGEACQLSWTRRMKIVIGIAKGLKYLHTELNPPFTISELNSNAVYLTEDFSPKLVDFESWKMILSRSEKNSGAISSEGAICILPNSLEGRYIDVQGNIYAFGVLLLEIISGRPPYCKDKGSLVDWAKEYLEVPEAMSNLVDPELKHFRYEDLKVVCGVINTCIYPDSNCRASMKDLCAVLESDIDTSISAELKASSLAWAELALSS